MPKFGNEFNHQRMESNKVLSAKILKGVQLAIKKLLKEARENDDTLVISQNGKVVHIKARKFKAPR
jgi:hypothetical protein